MVCISLSNRDDTFAMNDEMTIDQNHLEQKDHDEPESYRKIAREERVRNAEQNGIQ